MVEQKIATAVRGLSDKRQQRDMRTIAEEKEAINLLIEKKYAMNAGGSLDNAAQLAELKQQLYDLEMGTGGSKHALVAPASGVFSSKVDGMEDELSLDKAESLTPSYFRELDKMQLERNEDVVLNEPVCKVVDNYGWYFAAAIDAEKAEELQVGQSVKLHFFDLSDTEIYGTIRTISAPEKGEVAISIYTNRYVEGIFASSRATAEIVITGIEGIKLPVESIHVKDGQPGVYVLRLDVARFVPVNIRYKNESWAIVSAATDIYSDYKLQIYDEVIVEAKNLEDGKVVR
jgi:putative membrane fusion protein